MDYSRNVFSKIPDFDQHLKTESNKTFDLWYWFPIILNAPAISTLNLILRQLDANYQKLHVKFPNTFPVY